jgi:F-type H+-transporting ATPase subunit epsilon
VAAFQLEVVSPEGTVWSGQATLLITRSSLDGELGILANHEPLMATLVPWSAEIVPPSGPRVTLAVGNGFLQVLANRVTLLADRAVLVEEGVAAARVIALQLAGAVA